MKIGLGTVQFGMPYGVSNTVGMTGPDEVKRILRYSEGRGVKILDTAAAYGASEKTLGRSLSKTSSFNIVTKTFPLKSDFVDFESIALLDQRFNESLNKLQREFVYGLLVHQAKDLLKDGADLLVDWLMKQKESGKATKVGVSVYDREMLDLILEEHDIDLVQLPLNILDQRLLADDYLSKLKSAGIEIHVRSVFLQGLLLMEPNKLPPYFYSIKDHMVELRSFMKQLGLSPLEAAIGFVSSIEEVDSVICGVNTLKQLEEIVACSEVQVSVESFRTFAINDKSILDPSQWRLS